MLLQLFSACHNHDRKITVTNTKPYVIKCIFLTADLGVVSERNKKKCDNWGIIKHILVKQ
jgi:hypothetical protein